MRSSPAAAFATLVAAATLVVGAAPLAAQDASERAASVVAGAMMFDPSGTGAAPAALCVAPIFGLRVDRVLVGRWLVGEAGLGYAPLAEPSQGAPTQLGVRSG